MQPRITLLHQVPFELLLAQTPTNQHPSSSAVVSAIQIANPVDLLYGPGWSLPKFPKTCWTPRGAPQKGQKREKRKAGKKRSWCGSVLNSQKYNVVTFIEADRGNDRQPSRKSFSSVFHQIVQFKKCSLYAVLKISTSCSYHWVKKCCGDWRNYFFLVLCYFCCIYFCANCFKSMFQTLRNWDPFKWTS